MRAICKTDAGYAIEFDHAECLHCRSDAPQGFYIFDNKGLQCKAEALLDGARVLISGEDVQGIGYCYRNYAVADMYNENGLPMLPFYQSIE